MIYICTRRRRKNFAEIITFRFSPSDDNFRSSKQNISLSALDWFASLNSNSPSCYLCRGHWDIHCCCETAPRHCGAERNSLKKTRENKGKEDVYKERRRLENGSLCFLIRRATTLAFDRRAARHFVPVVDRERERERRGGTQGSPVINIRTGRACYTWPSFCPRPRVSSSAGITFLRAPNRASVTGELNELPFFLFLFHLFFFSLFSFLSFVHIPVTQCFATLRLSAF